MHDTPETRDKVPTSSGPVRSNALLVNLDILKFVR